MSVAAGRPSEATPTLSALRQGLVERHEACAPKEGQGEISKAEYEEMRDDSDV